MINISGSNRLHDLYRLMRLLLTYLVFAILGFLVCHYYNEQKSIQNTPNTTVTCLSPALEVKSYLVRLPSTGPDSASCR